MNDEKIKNDIIDNIESLNYEDQLKIISTICNNISINLFCEGELKAMNEIDEIEKKLHKFYKKYNQERY